MKLLGTNIAKRSLILFIPVIIFGIMMFASINHYVVNVPYSDQWDFVTYLHKLDTHTLSLGDMFTQHNEHRIPFPLTVLLISARVTSWNTKAETILSLLFSMISIVLILRMVRGKVRSKYSLAIVCTLLCAWFFSPIQWENWLWGWQIEWFMNIAGVTSVIYCLTMLKKPLSYPIIFLVGLLAFFATFSLGSGMLIWLIGIVILFIRRRAKLALRVWLPMFLVTAGIYYHHYVNPSYDPSPTVALGHPISVAKFYLSLFGSTVSGNTHTTIIIGSLLLSILIPIVYAIYITKDKITEYLPGLALIAYALMAAGTTSISRTGFGLDYSLSSRYTAFTLLYIIGIIVTVVSISSNIKRTNSNRMLSRAVGLGLLTFSFVLLMLSYVNGFNDMSHYSVNLKNIKSCTSELYPSNACLRSTYFSPTIARADLNYLKHKHYAGY